MSPASGPRHPPSQSARGLAQSKTLRAFGGQKSPVDAHFAVFHQKSSTLVVFAAF